jgi:hypothetical protein
MGVFTTTNVKRILTCRWRVIAKALELRLEGGRMLQQRIEVVLSV